MTKKLQEKKQKEKLSHVRVSEDDFEVIKQLQKEWELPNQQAVINCLIESHKKKVDVATELLEAKAHIAQLERLCNQLQEQNNQLTTEKLKTNDPVAINNRTIVLQTQSHVLGSNWLDGRTFDGTVGLAPSTEGGFTGTRWKVHDVGNGIITLECLGHIPGSRWLDGRTDNATVGLAPSTEGGFTGTRWRIHDVGNGIITLECLGHIPGSRWLNGRTDNATVGLAPSTEGEFTGTRWKVFLHSDGNLSRVY